MSKELELETDHVDYRIAKKKAPVGEEKVINDHIADKETAQKIFAGVVDDLKIIYREETLRRPTEDKIVVHLEEVTRLFEPGVSKIIYCLEENKVKTEVKEDPEGDPECDEETDLDQEST